MKLKLSTLVLLSLSLSLGLSFPASALAAASAEYQTCAPNTVCTVGEFLYDDEYAPIATADCRLTSRDPAGALFLNSQAMSPATDGWYQTTVSTASAVGIYRSQVCWTAGADYLCLDKTFQVVATPSALTAADVWANGTRTLSSYGDIASDVWGYSSRSLSGFGTLIADIWSNATRTITGGGDTVTNNTTNNNSGAVTQNISGNVTNQTTSNVTSAQLSSLTALTAENRKLLEQLVNKPVIKTFIDDGGCSLQAKLEKTKITANRLYTSIANLKSRAELLDLEWSTLSQPEIELELKTINDILKENNLSENSSLPSATNWLKTAWNASLITLSLADQAEAAQSKIETLIGDLSLFGKTNSSLTFKSALAHIQRLDTLVGTSLSPASDTSLFGFVKKIDQLATNLNHEAEAIKLALDKFDGYTPEEQNKLITDHTKKVLASNQVPKAETLISPAVKNVAKDNKNRILALLGLVRTNLSWLTNGNGKAINSIWLEEGSIVFRAVVSNPSKLVSQKVPVEIYLPEEIKPEQIIKSDPELKIEFNTDDNRLWARANIELAPLETRTLLVEVEDIWSYTVEEIDSLRKQSTSLYDALKGTSYLAQATTLHSDIAVTLDKVLLRQKQATTPENRIRTHRESRLEMAGIGEKINGLKTLVGQAGASSSIFGFVGGVQSVAVWGMVIIFVAGFVFLTIYMRALRLEQFRFSTATVLPVDHKHKPLPPAEVTRQIVRKKTLSAARRLTRTTMIILLTGSFASFGASVIISAARRNNNTTTLTSPLVTGGIVLGSFSPTKATESPSGN